MEGEEEIVLTPEEQSKKVNIVTSDGSFELEWGKLYDNLAKFAAEGKFGEELKLPSSLTSKQRRLVHQIAERLCLNHGSRGQRDKDRHIVISRKSTPDEVKITENKLKDKFEKIPLGISEILPGFLYLGSSRDSRDLEQLRKLNIKHILNCAKEWKNMNEEIFNFYNAGLMDVEEQNLLNALESSFSFIEIARSKKEPLLVHCIVGKSRSAEMEVSLYKSNTLQTGDWTPITVRQAPKKVATKEEVSSFILEFVKEFVTQEFMLELAKKQFDDNFEKKFIGAFIVAVSNKLSTDETVIQKLEEKGLKWKDVAKSVNDEAKSFFVKQMEKSL